jgi:hypothetical protein
MKTRASFWLIPLAVLLGFVLLMPTRALGDDDDDPPSRVARLSYANGQVSFSPAGIDDWVSAVLNRPITTGDKLWTDQNSRAELQIGSASIRLGDSTGFSFLNLDDRAMQIRLTEGTINLRVRHLDDNETIEIDTPNLAFSVLRPGRYRLNVNENGDTTIIDVRDGQGEVTGGGSAYTVHAGQEGYFSGTDSLSADVQDLPGEDDFDSWCEERDLRQDHAAARRYVSDDVIGYEDLDQYGGWRPVPEYGTIWFPHTTVVGWAPYRYGHWVWISPWGWTWVDDEPWGFAPFHYGRWVFVGGAWGWVPCPPRTVAVAYVRPVYAPALVAWVGGPHFAVGVAIGGGVNVGWFPLGPREVFVPSYPVSRRYVNNVNISNTTVNTTVINNYYNTTIVNKNVTVNNVRYANQQVPGAVTATTGTTFTSAQPVSRNLVKVDQREMASAPPVARAPATVPQKQSVLGAGAAARVRPPAVVQNRPVVAKTPPPPPPPSFAVHQQAIQRNNGQPISVAQTRQIETQTQAQAQTHTNVAPVRVAPPAKAATLTYRQPNDNRGNNQPGQMNANRPNNVQQGNNNRPPATNQQQTPNQQTPTNQNQNNRPANVQTNQPPNNRRYQDRPPTSRPTPPTNPQLEQKHEQQNQNLQQKQDQQFRQLEQKQQQEQQQLQQQRADQQKQQQIQQREQQQREQLQQRQQQQQRQLEQKQQAEHQKAYREPPPQKQEQKQQQSKDKPKDDNKHR